MKQALGSVAIFMGLGWAGVAPAQVHYTPLEFRTVEGIRPFVPVELNGTRFVFMVHANASFFVMTTHANAAKAGVAETRRDEDFGIDAPGRVSSAGRTNTTLKSLKVGGHENRDVPFSIFEVPVEDMDGMLGIGWLRENKVIVDYSGTRLGFPASEDDARAERDRLVRLGYTAHKMTWDAKRNRFLIPAVVNKEPSWMVVSTVSSNIVDIRYAKRAGIGLGPVVYRDAGPRGATVDNWLAREPIRMTVDGQKTTWMQPIVQDTYAYSSQPAPKEAEQLLGGYLGCDFMLANQAVIDFGAGVLLLKPMRQ